MERRPDDLTGMSVDQAREYIAAHLASLKLTEKKLAELNAAVEKWRGRSRLAADKGAAELAAEADAEAARLEADAVRIGAEAEELRNMIAGMRRQLGALPASQRSIDPDLLEQELVMAAGGIPGDENPDRTARKIAEMEKDAAADAALAELKAKAARENGGR